MKSKKLDRREGIFFVFCASKRNHTCFAVKLSCITRFHSSVFVFCAFKRKHTCFGTYSCPASQSSFAAFIQAAVISGRKQLGLLSVRHSLNSSCPFSIPVHIFPVPSGQKFIWQNPRFIYSAPFRNCYPSSVCLHQPTSQPKLWHSFTDMQSTFHVSTPKKNIVFSASVCP